MKVSKAQSAENRQGILDAAARLYRERGLSGVGVADITRDAGLTHGGLYRHFASKDALVREACARAFDWSIAPLDGAEGATGLAARVNSYLSATHRDRPGEGCPAAALAVDAARAGSDLSEVFARGIERNIDRFARVIEELAPDGGPISAEGRARAMEMLATMVGGLVLARATAAAQPALSDEILATLRDRLNAPEDKAV
ncbi:TetR/AcrR family transcriptional regulator [Acidovorax sp. SUPP1855]|uniref:TetR/AcrR family transcriptional regulator n=1 Tax=unclassified Acidovorax TaxID=2684926 RepID=UPI0023DE4C5D|nr:MULTISPECIES: TetR/AcrR family transcriptional regulator [unclassified Acidovorax]GKS84951.1 TetR/AcrR family transcriptional regulator [Acidovorax sp. SUPP1855]GKS90042.1 TetR/AcrR family transcriptional regulator [Acidovorax sp. SUPP2539]